MCTMIVHVSTYLSASLGKHIRQRTRNFTCRIKHFLPVIHDAHSRIFRKDYDIHARQAHFCSLDNVTYLLGVGKYLVGSVETWLGILKDTDADGVGRAGDVAMA